MREALQTGVIDAEVENWPEQCRDVDLVFLATPLTVICEHLKQLNGVVAPSTIVSDLGSTKREILNLVEEIQFSGTYIGGHPMTGAEKSGLHAANPLLYENAVYVLCTPKENKLRLAASPLINLLQSLKARLLFLDAQTHDRILAAISHLPQLAAIAMVNLVGAKNNAENPYFELAAGGFRDLTRIASSSIGIWQDIISSNKSNVRQVLQEFIELLKSELEQIDDLQNLFQSANAFRQQLPVRGKGFLQPLTDIMVYVTDEMGVVARIANALSARQIDIRDIELLKIREKEGGVFRLSLADGQEAETAINVLNSIGYKAFIRE